MSDVLSTSDYSNWPDWLIKLRINHIERDIANIDKKLQEQESIHKEYLNQCEKHRIRLERHKHLLRDENESKNRTI